MRKTILKGVAGKATARTIANRFKTVNFKILSDVFALRNETDFAWRCEFWGKIIRPAITCAYVTGDQELRKIIDNTVIDIMNAQTPDGCISSYPEELQCAQSKGWDIWGRKYILLGLMRYYELLNPDPAVLNCCCKMMDHLISQVGPGKEDILACGCHAGLASASILGAVVALYRLSGDKKYYDFAEYLISKGGTYIGNIYDCVEIGVTPASLGNGKAYEMTSCFQGLAEITLLHPDQRRKDLLTTYYNAVLNREIFITGTGGNKDCVGEFWYDGALRQTRSDCGALGETCVTATWMRYCVRMLQLNDDPKIADEIEKSLYNALLGALAPDGSHWVHVNPTPLTGGGYKQCAEDQIEQCFKKPFDGNDCCRAQGPEGLAVAAEIAVMDSADKVTVNLFEALETENLTITGDYPFAPRAVIQFNDPAQKVLRVRTPEFLKGVTFNGKPISFIPGTYLELPHQAMTNDVVVLDFDFTLKEIVSPCGKYVAVKRGPILLAEDSRGIVPHAQIKEQWNGRNLCEYAVAGDLLEKTNTLTVWFKRG